MPLRDEFRGEGIEALLARTRRQMSLFILGATALIVVAVGVGGAVAGNSALDAGLDNALVARAERIVTSGLHPDDAPASIPPEMSDEEFGVGGPWAVLDATGAILARSAGVELHSQSSP